MRTIAHVTHEAVHKVGGIGAVVEGLLTSKAYQNEVGGISEILNNNQHLILVNKDNFKSVIDLVEEYI